MPKRQSPNVAKKAFAKAEADFATWLMMAKLGSFEDLPPQAQGWLMNYRRRLERMKEAEATRATIQEMYTAYYTEMGGGGEAPVLAGDVARSGEKVIALKDFRPATVSRLAGSPAPARSGRSLQPFLIFAGLVAALAAAKFAFGF